MSYKFQKREFLNDDLTKSAHIIAYVEESEVDEDSGKLWGADASIEIADCNRKVSLDFYLGTDPEENDKILKKVTLLIDTLKDFEKALTKEAKFIKNYKQL